MTHEHDYRRQVDGLDKAYPVTFNILDWIERHETAMLLVALGVAVVACAAVWEWR